MQSTGDAKRSLGNSDSINVIALLSYDQPANGAFNQKLDLNQLMFESYATIGDAVHDIFYKVMGRHFAFMGKLSKRRNSFGFSMTHGKKRTLGHGGRRTNAFLCCY